MGTEEQNVVVVHYGEIALKGHNRKFFENSLKRNIKRALAGIHFDEVERLRGRFIIRFSERVEPQAITRGLSKVFGISHFSFGLSVKRDLETIQQAAWALIKDREFDSFKIETRRGQKDFPLNSMAINREVGAYVQERCKKRVDLTKPELTVFIEIVENEACLYTDKIRGLRGLPVGVSGKAVSLISSGIDSPVASYLMLKRGVNLVYTHFHSQPFTSMASQENTARLVRVLTEYQFQSKIYFIPFIDIQKEIMAKAPPRLRVLLYRRYMVRLSERVAKLEKAKALVTGENVAQVASQTLSNIRVVGEVTPLPILRPLAGFDKEEIVELAKRIATFEISIEPYEDCCSLFVPENPETQAHPKSVQIAEKELEMENLMHEAMEKAEIRVVKQGSN